MVTAMYLPSLLIAWQPMQCPLAAPPTQAWGAPRYAGVLPGPPSSVQTIAGNAFAWEKS